MKGTLTWRVVPNKYIQRSYIYYFFAFLNMVHSFPWQHNSATPFPEKRREAVLCCLSLRFLICKMGAVSVQDSLGTRVPVVTNTMGEVKCVSQGKVSQTSSCVCVCPDFDHIFVLPLKSYYFLYNHFDLIIPTKSQNKVLVLCIFLLIRIKIDTQPWR